MAAVFRNYHERMTFIRFDLRDVHREQNLPPFPFNSELKRLNSRIEKRRREMRRRAELGLPKVPLTLNQELAKMAAAGELEDKKRNEPLKHQLESMTSICTCSFLAPFCRRLTKNHIWFFANFGCDIAQ